MLETVNIGYSHIYEFVLVFKDALNKYRIWKKKNTEYSLNKFIEYCHNKRYVSDLNIEYYENNGNWIKNSQFLFGEASQFR